MSKFFSKTIKKTTLWATLIAIIVAAGIVVCALFGFNKDVTLTDAKTLTVSVNTFAYESKKDEIEDDCKEIFKAAGADLEYTVKGEMGGDVCEIVFVFDKDTDVAALKEAVAKNLANKISTDAAWNGVFVNVSAASETTQDFLAKHFVLRAAIAGAVFTVLALAYVAIRYKNFCIGLVAGVSVLLGMALTASLMVLTRVFVTPSAAAVIGISGLLTATMVLFTLGKVHAAQKDNAEATNEERVSGNVAAKEIAYIAITLAVAVVLIGALGRMAAIWFAASALLAILSSVFVSLFFAPAMYFGVKTALDNKPAKETYVGAKKTSKKEKKTYAPAKKAAPVEETPVTEEEPVEEVVEEPAPVEETEIAEEPVEEVVEESAPVEEEEVVEEPASVEETEEETEE